MKCPRCQHENPQGARFCEECATPLARACSNCGAGLSATAKFCHACAHPVASTGGTPSRSPDSYIPKYLAEKILTSKGSLEGERKQVTVLFADLKGSMELLADRDPEEARKILDPVLERLMEAVHRYEGTVNQVMGDGIMALFGAPLAHEDHAVRACYAALRMQDAVRRYAEEARQAHGVNVQIRVGLNSGEVVVRAIGSDLRMDYTAVGQTTHLAARMEQLATPGSILVTGTTFQLAEGYVTFKSLGTAPVKGLAEPVAIHEATGPASARSRLQASALRGLTRFVGRTTEIDWLTEALDRARGGHGHVVGVVGEPGVGKSRLFWEFVRSPRTDGCLVLESAAASYGKAAFYLPVIEMLRRYMQIADSDTAGRIREKVIGKVLGLDERLKGAIAPLLGLLDALPEDDDFRALDPPQRRGRTLDALRQVLLGESRRQPVVFVLEDLHWIDSATQAFLDALIESLPTAKVLLLVNYRPEYRHDWGSKTYYTQVRLDALPAASADELLQALLGDDASLRPLKRLLIERTEGNPFFLEESVRILLEGSSLSGESGARFLTRPIHTLELPNTVQTILGARIDRLPAEQKHLLQAASVIGKDLPLAILHEIGDLADDELRASLAGLQTAEFLQETSLFPDPEYTFKHALTQEVAYASLLHERRGVLHRRLGQFIERRYAERLGEFYDVLATHFDRGGIGDKAIHYLSRAAEKAKEQFAYQDASDLCQRAIEIAERATISSAMRAPVLVLLGDLWSLRGDLQRANQNYDLALGTTTEPAERRRITNKRHEPRIALRDGARIAFYEHGSGDATLVLMTPVAYGLAAFQRMIERLCQEFRIITIDPRGTGASDPLRRPYRITDHMKDLRAVIEASWRRPVVGVGLSKGGAMMVRLAVAEPGLFKALVLVGTPLNDDLQSLNHARRLAGGGDLEGACRFWFAATNSEPGLDHLEDQYVKSRMVLAKDTLLSFFEPDPETDITPLLPDISVPTLVLFGTDDRVVPFTAGRELARRIPGAQFYAFSGRGHVPVFTATSEACGILRDFARRETTAPARSDHPDFTQEFPRKLRPTRGKDPHRRRRKQP
jgi:class 3 adenylate cyclase/pimeloyl-ACP methyl ester carboxylesterase